MNTRRAWWTLVGVMAAWSFGISCLAAEEVGSEIAPTVHDGATVQLRYTLTVDGAVVDSNTEGEPLSYVHGQGQLIPGLEQQLIGLSVGDQKDVTVRPAEGYGEVDPEAFVEMERSQLPPEPEPIVGMFVNGRSSDGRPFQARIDKVEGERVTLDFNHPLAGKALRFQVEVVNIAP